MKKNIEKFIKMFFTYLVGRYIVPYRRGGGDGGGGGGADGLTAVCGLNIIFKN